MRVLFLTLLALTACCIGQVMARGPSTAESSQALLPATTRVEILSERTLTLVFSGDHIEALNNTPSSYRLIAELSAGSWRRPVLVGRDRQAVDVDDRGVAKLETRLHLHFLHPLQQDMSYRLTYRRPAGKTVTLGTLDLRQRDDLSTSSAQTWRHASPSIQVNQVGYLTDASKHAYVGNWLGDAGGMPVSAKHFEVLDAQSGAVVFDARLKPRSGRRISHAGHAKQRPEDPWSGNRVLEADFSGLRRAGRYRVFVPGIGYSHAFEIGDDVYRSVYRTTARLFFHSRNGMAIALPWADLPHQRLTTGVPSDMDARLHHSVERSPLPHAATGGYHAVSQGWFDAGDYGQYIPNAAPVWWAFGLGFDLAPNQFDDTELNIPESGNGIPDLIDELEWGMDWALAMQDADGGVHFRLASERWDEGLPSEITEPRYLFEKTTHATADFAAIAAIHARLIRPYRPQRADRVLLAALRAWAFIEAQPLWPEEGERYRNAPGVHAGEYADSSSRDNRLWAAAELLRTTSDPRFAQAYAELNSGLKTDPTAHVSYRQQEMAAFWAYLQAAPAATDETLRKAARKQLIDGAEWRLRMAAEHPFRAPMHPRRELTGWGNFAQSTRHVLPLLQAHRLTGERRFRDLAEQMSNPQLGANPQSRSYITGIGANSPNRPLSKLSRYLRSSAQSGAVPLRGIPVNGPHFNLPNSWPSTRAVNAAYHPTITASNSYPALRRYTDAYPLPPMSEPTVAEYAATAIAYGLLGKL